MQSNTDPVRFGLNLDPGIAPGAQLVDAVRLAERSGFDLIGIQDRGQERADRFHPERRQSGLATSGDAGEGGGARASRGRPWGTR